jgi:ubiquinone/menaquinone biosynthesis C-methylase UbiE
MKFSKEKGMINRKNHVCPVEMAGHLDFSLRKWLQNPQKILAPHIKEGMTVLDFGCGPGFFSVDLARLVGASGRVIAADLQQGMLDKLSRKGQGTELQNRITLHKCQSDKIGLSEKVDFVLAFYMVHELPDQDRFFNELSSILKTKGQVLIVEPPFHVSKSAFEKTIRKAQNNGFVLAERPKVFLSKTAVLKKA